MTRRAGLFDNETGAPSLPRLDATRLIQQPFAWLTPNRVVAACRVALAGLLLVAMVVGPDGLASIGLRFVIAYSVTLIAMPAFPRLGGRSLGGVIALLFGARWAFTTLDAARTEMLMTQLAGIVCALVPVYARNVGGLAGSVEGHISFTERRAMWRQRSAGTAPAAPRTPPRSSPPPAPAQAASIVALLDYRPEVTG